MAAENGEWVIHGLDWDNPYRIRSYQELINWINEVGFLPLFRNEIEGFSAEEHTSPRFWWRGDSGCRRTVVEHIDIAALTVFHTLLEDLILFPELLYFFLSVDKIQICRNFFLHVMLTSFFVTLQKQLLVYPP